MLESESEGFGSLCEPLKISKEVEAFVELSSGVTIAPEQTTSELAKQAAVKSIALQFIYKISVNQHSRLLLKKRDNSH